MSRTISQRQLRNQNAEIMRDLEDGQTFTVTRNGVPVAELRPARRHVARTAILLDAIRNAPTIDADRFFADIDAVADQDPTPRG